MSLDDVKLVDYETAGRLDLKKVGAFVYSQDPSTTVHFVGCADPEGTPYITDALPPSGTFVSWGEFDRLIYETRSHTKGTKAVASFIDAMAIARYAGLPGRLNDFCRVMGIEVRKDRRGKALIQKYSRPDPATGEFLPLCGDDRAEFEAYCIRDVELLQRAWKILKGIHPEWERICRPGYEATMRMNRYGAPIDREAVAGALEQCQRQEGELEKRCQMLSQLRPTQTIALADFLGLPNATKATLEATRFDDPVKEEVRQIRLDYAKAATKKLVPMLAMSAVTERVHGCFVYNGAHTGRGSSIGIQLQNMVREKVDPEALAAFRDRIPLRNPLEEARKNIRGFIRAPEGRLFAVADYSQIEARIVAFLSGSKEMLAAFADDSRDIYSEFAAEAFGIPLPSVSRDDHRPYGKVIVLGAGYGAGGEALATQSVSYGLTPNPALMARLKKVYLQKYPEVEKLWAAYDDAAFQVVTRSTPGAVEVGPVAFQLNATGQVLEVHMPSGRVMRFLKPAIEDHPFRFGEQTLMVTTKHGRRSVWGGHWTENIAQSIAGDIKTAALVAVTNQLPNTPVIMEVHDELVVECMDDESDHVLDRVLNLMCEVENCLPPGLLKAEGSTMEFYSK